MMAGKVRFLWVLCAVLASSSLAGAQQAATIVQPGVPGQPSKVLPSNTRPAAAVITRADVDFMQGMIMHHQQAVEMTALIPSHTENAQVRALGARIGHSQADEIRFMKRWLITRGQSTDMQMKDMPGMAAGDMLMPGMLTPAQMEALRNARGAEFDRLFLSGMIQHHGGALTMVADLYRQPGAGQDAEIFNFTTDVDSGQRAEIRIMQNLLQQEK